MRRAIIAESHRQDKSQEYLNIHRDNKLTKAEGVFGDLRLMGRGGAGSMCLGFNQIIFRHVYRECKLIPKCLFLCFWNSGDARKYKGKHFFFFFCCGNSLLEWNVGHPDPLASHLHLSLFQWGHGVAA